ncbi:hypothetical protein ABZ695_03025 [Streptomyces sp. NPDC006976]|uniref:hypothetical protein n=1 Tax=Streptomyces sp. NPDC006976 TaxID=3154311 RepID=UPI0033EEC799
MCGRRPDRIRVEELAKHYRRPQSFDGFLGGVRTLCTREAEEVRAVDGVSFTIEAGELVGGLGPNGAGQSTRVMLRIRLDRIVPGNTD